MDAVEGRTGWDDEDVWAIASATAEFKSSGSFSTVFVSPRLKRAKRAIWMFSPIVEM